MKTQNRKLTPKQKCFVDEYLVSLDASKSAIAAGYSSKTCGQVGYQLLQKTSVQEAIQVKKDARSKRTEINADYVLTRLVEIDQMDCIDILNDNGSVKPISQWPQIWRQFISGFEVADMLEGSGEEREQVGLLKKIKWPDKTKNLELIGKHVNVKAFQDRVEISGSVDIASRILEGRKRERQKLSTEEDG